MRKYLIQSYDGTIQRRYVKYSNLKKYYNIIGHLKNRNIYQRITKYINPDKTVRAISKFDHRLIYRMHWNMKDYFLDDETLDKFLKEIREKRYDGVKNRSPAYEIQRIGCTLFRGEPLQEIIIKDGKRQERELVDFVTTTSYEREKQATNAMFDELAEKLIRYQMNQSVSPSLFEDRDTESVYCREFIVYYTQKGRAIKPRVWT